MFGEAVLPPFYSKEVKGEFHMINAVIIEDDALFAEYFKSVIEKISEEKNIDFHLDCLIVPVSIENIQKNYDIYFFDIELETESGIELACTLRRKYIDKDFIFVSSYEKYLRGCMKARPSAFVRKLHLENDLKETFETMERLFAIKEKEVILKNNFSDYKVHVSEIMYISSREHYLFLNKVNGTTDIIRNKMKAVAVQLQKYDFLRINQSYIINLMYLEDFCGKSVVMKDGERINVTDTYYMEAAEVLHNWLMRGFW